MKREQAAVRASHHSDDLIERIANDSFHSPFIAAYTKELRRVLNSPNGGVHDTMIGDLYKRLAQLYSSIPVESKDEDEHRKQSFSISN